jgi:hypothetical protein
VSVHFSALADTGGIAPWTRIKGSCSRPRKAQGARRRRQSGSSELSGLTEPSPQASADSAIGVRAELTRRVKQAGLLSRRPGYYTAEVGVIVLGYGAAAARVSGWVYAVG